MNIQQSITTTISSNKIYSSSERITTVYGMSLNPINATATNPVLITNNEVILYASAANTRGIYATGCKADIYHNSVLIKGTGDAHAFYLMNSTHDYTIKNNNFITLAGSTAAPILLGGIRNVGTSWFIDYNNYYTSGNVIGYTGSSTTTPANIKSTLAAWKAVVATDTNW